MDPTDILKQNTDLSPEPGLSSAGNELKSNRDLSNEGLIPIEEDVVPDIDQEDESENEEILSVFEEDNAPIVSEDQQLDDEVDEAIEGLEEDVLTTEDPSIKAQVEDDREAEVKKAQVKTSDISKTVKKVVEESEKATKAVSKLVGEKLGDAKDSAPTFFDGLVKGLKEQNPIKARIAEMVPVAAEKVINGFIGMVPDLWNMTKDLGIHDGKRVVTPTIDDVVNKVMDVTGLKDKYELGDIDVVKDEKWKESAHWTEKFVVEAAPFLITYMGVRGAVGLPKLLSKAQGAKGLAKGGLYASYLSSEMFLNGLVDSLLIDEKDDNLADFISKYPPLKDTFLKYLTTDEDDTELDRRLKNFAIGAGLGGSMEVLFLTVGKFLTKLSANKTSPSARMTKESLKSAGIHSSDDLINKSVSTKETADAAKTADGKPKAEPKEKVSKPKGDPDTIEIPQKGPKETHLGYDKSTDPEVIDIRNEIAKDGGPISEGVVEAALRPFKNVSPELAAKETNRIRHKYFKGQEFNIEIANNETMDVIEKAFNVHTVGEDVSGNINKIYSSISKIVQEGNIDIKNIRPERLKTFVDKFGTDQIDEFVRSHASSKGIRRTADVNPTIFEKEGEEFIKNIDNLTTHTGDIGQVRNRYVDLLIQASDYAKEIKNARGAKSVSYQQALDKFNAVASRYDVFEQAVRSRTSAVGTALRNVKASEFEKSRLTELAERLEGIVEKKIIKDKDKILQFIKDEYTSTEQKMDLISKYLNKNTRGLLITSKDGGKVTLEMMDAQRGLLNSIADNAVSLATFNILSGISTRVLIAGAGVARFGIKLADDLVKDSLNLANLSTRKLVGARTGHVPRESFFANTLLETMSGAGKAFRDAGSFIAGTKELADYRGRIFTNARSFDNSAKNVVDFNLSNPFENLKNSLRKQKGRAIAKVAEMFVHAIDVAFGVRVIQGIDIFFESAKFKTNIREVTVDTIRGKYRKVINQPSEELIKKEIEDVYAKSMKQAADGDFSGSILSEAKRRNDEFLFKSNEQGIVGGQYVNAGQIVKTLTGGAKQNLGAVGKFASMFSRVATNASDFMAQRIPGVNLLNPTIRKNWDRYGSQGEMSKLIGGVGVATLWYAKELKDSRVIINRTRKERQTTADITGNYINDIAYINDDEEGIQTKGGKLHIVDATHPIGALWTFYSRFMDNIGDFQEDNKSFDNTLQDIFLDVVRSLNPFTFIGNVTDMIEFMDDVMEGKEPKSGLGDRLTHAGVFREISDIRRGYTLAQSPNKEHQINSNFDIEKKEIQLKISRFLDNTNLYSRDTGTVPRVDFLGNPIQYFNGNARDKLGMRDLGDLWGYFTDDRPYDNDPLRQELLTITDNFSEEEDQNTKINLALYPRDEFTLNEVLSVKKKEEIFQLFTETKRFIRAKLNDTLNERFRFNDNDVYHLRRLAAGKNISVRMKGVKNPVKVDFEREARNVGDLSYAIEDDALLQRFSGFKYHFNKYGYTKEKALRNALTRPDYRKIKSLADKAISKKNAEVGKLITLQEKIDIAKGVFDQNYGKSYTNISGQSMVAKIRPKFTQETLDFEYNYLKLRLSYTTDPVEQDNIKKRMVNVVSKIVRPYNNFARLLYIDKIYNKNEAFEDRFVRPLYERLDDEYHKSNRVHMMDRFSGGDPDSVRKSFGDINKSNEFKSPLPESPENEEIFLDPTQ